MNKVLIIAEAGVNHNGSMEIARQLIDAAADAGADYVKFQTFRTEKLVSKAAPKAEYQDKNTGDVSGSQYDMLKKLELSKQDHLELISYCNKKSIKFLSTAFDLESIDLLNSLNIQLFKIPSGEITNLPYLEKIGSLNKDVIVSTGMCVMSEIEDAIDVLEKAGTNRKNISVLHCTTDYPTAMKDVNLKAMLEIRRVTGLPVGYSDHTAGIEVPVAAVALGAEIIEKHFTIDRMLPGPDHKASLEPGELKAMITAIRNVEIALGSSEKQPTDTERRNMLVARKSIHLARPVSRGVQLSESDLVMKRPGDGISAMKLHEVKGRRITRDLEADHKLTEEDLE
jgi:N-acetylneuraminate synthase